MMTMFFERLGLRKKNLHRHPETHCTLRLYESGSQLLVLHPIFCRIGGPWPPSGYATVWIALWNIVRCLNSLVWLLAALLSIRNFVLHFGHIYYVPARN